MTLQYFANDHIENGNINSSMVENNQIKFASSIASISKRKCIKLNYITNDARLYCIITLNLQKIDSPKEFSQWNFLSEFFDGKHHKNPHLETSLRRMRKNQQPDTGFELIVAKQYFIGLIISIKKVILLLSLA
jgi:hypothetical protein